jgi:hypothetical protein
MNCRSVAAVPMKKMEFHYRLSIGHDFARMKSSTMKIRHQVKDFHGSV